MDKQWIKKQIKIRKEIIESSKAVIKHEKAEIQRAEESIKGIQSSCEHEMVVDEEATYSGITATCTICGHVVGA